MRLNNRGSLAHGGTNPSLTNGSSSRMRGEREEQKRKKRRRKRHSVDRPRSRDSRCKKRDYGWSMGRVAMPTHTHSHSSRIQGEAMRKNKQWRSENHKPRFVGLSPTGCIVYGGEKGGGEAKRHASRFYGHFFQLLRENVAFRPHVLLQLCIHVLSSALFKTGVRRTEYVLLRSAITSASAQYGRQKRRRPYESDAANGLGRSGYYPSRETRVKTTA